MTGLTRPGKWKGGTNVVKDSLLERILTAIVGTLWGYNSRSKNRCYTDRDK